MPQVHSTIRAVCYYHISNRIPPHSLITMQDTTSLITTNHIKIEISKNPSEFFFIVFFFAGFPSVFMCTFRVGANCLFYFQFTHDFESNEPQRFFFSSFFKHGMQFFSIELVNMRDVFNIKLNYVSFGYINVIMCGVSSALCAVLVSFFFVTFSSAAHKCLTLLGSERN